MAAGQGFKTFVTGEVLTAGDVNGYLMQGINVFANATARDAAITAPAEGQFAFTKDTNSLWYYDGAAWVASGATGDIEGVTAGVGISGGGTSGTVTITNSMATEIAAKGDLIAGTGSQTFDNLTVGANNTVLTADSTTATGLKWATPSGALTGWTLLNTGGTALTGATTITVSSLSAKQILVLVIGASSVNGTSNMTLRINADSAANYTFSGVSLVGSSTYQAGNLEGQGAYSTQTSFAFGRPSNNEDGELFASAFIDLADTTGWKSVNVLASGTVGSGNGQVGKLYQGIYEASAAITSISIISSSGNFDAGTVYVMGAN